MFTRGRGNVVTLTREQVVHLFVGLLVVITEGAGNLVTLTSGRREPAAIVYPAS